MRMPTSGLPPIRNSSHGVRLLVAGALALVAALALLYIALMIVSYLGGDSEHDAVAGGAVTLEDKYRILASLSGTSTLQEGDKKDMLREMRTEETLTHDEKIEILGNLKAR